MNPSIPRSTIRLALVTVPMLFGLLLVPQFSAAGGQAKGLAASTDKGQVLYTQFSLFHEGRAHRTTNYRKGLLVPANTEVTFVKATRKQIVVRLPDGEDLRIENIPDYSGQNIDGIFKRTFSTQKVDLSQFTDAERDAIAAGEVKVGMKKPAVLVAIGYPPAHQTPSLESDKWRYWRTRFNTFLVLFEGDQVSSIKN